MFKSSAQHFTKTREKPVLLLIVPFLLGLLLVFGVPLLSTPDELYHWQRAVQVSEGHFLPNRTENGQWGGKIDRGAFEYQIWFLRKLLDQKPILVDDAWREARELRPLSRERVHKPFPSTASFSPIAYFPQALGIDAARLVGANLFVQIVAGRLANLFVFFGLVSLTLRVLPSGRYVFAALACVPTALGLAGSLSADPLNFTIPALLIALCMRVRADPTFAFSTARALLIVCLAVGCGLLKMTSIIFCLALVLIPAAKFSGPIARWVFVTVGVLCAAAAAALWNAAFPFVPGVFWGNGADPAAALASIAMHPLQIVMTLIETLRLWLFEWLRGYFGQIGGGTGFGYFIANQTVFLAVGVLTALALADSAARRDIQQSAVLAVIAFAFLVSLLLAFFIGYTRIGNSFVEGINGRYLFGFFLLAAWSLSSMQRLGGWQSRLRIPLFVVATAVQVSVVLNALYWL